MPHHTLTNQIRQAVKVWHGVTNDTLNQDYFRNVFTIQKLQAGLRGDGQDVSILYRVLAGVTVCWTVQYLLWCPRDAQQYSLALPY